MAVDDEILWRNPFNFELKEVLINDSVRREALSKRDMRIFLDFIKNDSHYKRYYEGSFILFHTGLRVSEFCGLTVNDIDLEKKDDQRGQAAPKGEWKILHPFYKN